MMYFEVAAGFVLLLGAAEFMVRGSVALAKKLSISPLIIGMTIVAIGTSAPELVVGLQAAKAGASGMALGNVVGSNIANVLLILGSAGLVSVVVSKEGALLRDGIVLIAGSVLFAFFCMSGEIGQISGIILVSALVAFLYMSYRRVRTEGGSDAELHVEEVDEVGELPDNMLIVLLSLFGGLAGIVYGADILVDGAVQIARTFEVSEEVIGLTIVALGTSLPELAASVVAALRGHADVAIGNVVGSNLFNVLGIAGVVAIVSPLPVVEQIMTFDIWVMLASTVAMLPLLILGWKLTRLASVAFLILYCAYIAMQGYGVEKSLAMIW
ncbi:MAG: calcium/sodium antiporter [Rhodospirillales bacterium]|jgi:cation:H+ antiporter|nr:calcium/sodium antiporter [Rhodospirillales bacterium]